MGVETEVQPGSLHWGMRMGVLCARLSGRRREVLDRNIIPVMWSKTQLKRAMSIRRVLTRVTRTELRTVVGWGFEKNLGGTI